MPRPTPSHVTDAELLRVTRMLVERLRPLRIAIFGSRARGDARADSDYDLMVEVEEDRRAEVESLAADVRRDLRLRVDIWVTTPAKFAEQRDDVGYLAWQIDRDGRLLWARDEMATGQPLAAGRVRERRRGRPRSVAMWVRRAENDFLAIARMLDGGTPIPDAAAFHAHQSAEKYLKAAIVWSWRPPPRTHDLQALLDECPPALRADDRMRQVCEDLTKLLARSRYPYDVEPTESEARAAAECAALVRRAARTLMKCTDP